MQNGYRCMGIRCETVLESDFAQTTLCACVRTCMHACPPHIHVHKTNTVCINNGIILKQCNNCKRKKKGLGKNTIVDMMKIPVAWGCLNIRMFKVLQSRSFSQQSYKQFWVYLQYSSSRSNSSNSNEEEKEEEYMEASVTVMMQVSDL